MPLDTSVIGGLEDAMVARVLARAGNPFATVATVSDPQEIVVPMRPALLIFWAYTEVEADSAAAIAGVLRIYDNLIFTCLSLAGDGGAVPGSARRGPKGAYMLRDWVRRCFMAWEPVIPGYEIVFPMKPRGTEEPFMLDAGNYGVQQDFVIPVESSSELE